MNVSTYLAHELQEIAGSFAGEVSYCITDVAASETYELNSDAMMPTASAIKLPLLTLLYEMVETADIDLAEVCYPNDGRKSGGSGILENLSADVRLTYNDLAWLMICLSDNLATNIVIDKIGLARANDRLHEMAGGAMRLNGYAGHGAPKPEGSMGHASARAFRDYLCELTAGRHPLSERTIQVASDQQDKDCIRHYLNDLACEESGVLVANKGGALPGVRTDIGVVSAAGAEVVIAIMTRGSISQGSGYVHDGEECVASLARAAVGQIVGKRFVV